jgi:hypothetical protein
MRKWLFLLELVLGFSIDPSRVLVATIIDPNVERILRDSKLLFQSIRLFGGALNEATLLGCIIIDKEIPFQNNDLINAYTEMGIVVDFVPRFPDPFPGTMNKFSSFKFYDSSKFDYFLWLDADVVVFQDPFPLLDLRYRKGTISCVPEMYNYMRRFPAVNQSDLFWNPSLSKFILVDDELIAPHGLCNTGVLFFDSQSLSLFLSTLRHPIVPQLMSHYGTDRFLDSLCFVGIVNLAGIEIEPLDYALNYMAFLEIHIERLALTSHQPIFAHFIANSTLECYLAASDHKPSDCTCLYINDESVSSDSKIVNRIKELLLPLQHCRIFAGVNPLSTIVTSKVPESKLEAMMVSNERENCAPTVLFPTPEMSIFYDLDEVSFFLIASVSRDCVFGTCFNVIVQDLASDRVVFSADQNDWFPQQETLLVTFSFPLDLIQSNGVNELAISFSNQSLHISIVCRAKLSHGFRTYSHNYLVNQSPVALHSQLLLPEYLNTKRLTERGLVHCCDTWNGVLVVEQLIQKWGRCLSHGAERSENERNVLEEKPPMLVVIIKTLPTSQIVFESIEQLGNHFSELCLHSSHHLRCAITHSLRFDLFSENTPLPSVSSTIQQLSPLYRERFLSFVYLDCQTHVNELSRWYSALLPSGLLIGPEYIPSVLLQQLYREKYGGRDRPQFNSLLLKASAIDNFGFVKKISPLFTSSEYFLSSHPIDSLSCLPAWYFIKHDR